MLNFGECSSKFATPKMVQNVDIYFCFWLVNERILRLVPIFFGSLAIIF